MNCSYIAGIFALLEIFHIVLSKNTRELSVSNEDHNNEPSCDELRKMWRHTKREMQQKTEMVPRHKTTRFHEPFTYGYQAAARPRNAMKYTNQPVYGRIVYSPDKFLYRNNIPDRFRSFDKVARMVVPSSYYTPTLTAAPKPTFFRLEYPVRRPVVPIRISHIGRFQELQNVLRNERVGEMQMIKMKDGESNENSSNESNDNSGYDSFSYQQTPSEEDDEANSKGRKLRGTNRNMDINSFSDNKDGPLSIDLNEESDSISSTSRPIPLDESIPRRWALGEWKR